GAFVIDELTDLVEEAVMKEFEAISERGGVLGAMETGYQRGKIQEESLYYEHKKHDGSYPIVGVNTFRNPNAESTPHKIELARSTEEEKQSQLQRLADFHARHADNAPTALAKLRQTVIDDGNVFAELMNTVRVCSLGQITNALFEVGGQYRRSMCCGNRHWSVDSRSARRTHGGNSKAHRARAGSTRGERRRFCGAIRCALRQHVGCGRDTGEVQGVDRRQHFRRYSLRALSRSSSADGPWSKGHQGRVRR